MRLREPERMLEGSSTHNIGLLVRECAAPLTARSHRSRHAATEEPSVRQ